MEALLKRLNLPSPVSEVSTAWTDEANIKLLIKRDDLIHPLICGNKWRKLSGILKRYPDTKKIISYGGAWSNHTVAVAAVCQYLEIDCELRIRGEGPYPENQVLQICKSLGADVAFRSRSDYGLEKRTYTYDTGVLTIPEGGHCYDGTLGAVECYQEFAEKPDVLVLAVGTGTFLEGLQDITESDEVRLIGVPALKAGPNPHEYFAVEDATELWTEYHFGGFAKSTDELYENTVQFFRDTGILLDPIYTAKALYGLQDRLKKDRTLHKKTICLIHTGGISGWLGQKDSELRNEALKFLSEYLPGPQVY